MKLKINKACDLNSISVLPPHNRRSSMMQQPRSQPSQQSFSQGFSSQQNGIFSQISQNSFDEVLTENQRFGSQEKDNSVKRLSCLGPLSYPREESQMPISRSSSNLTRRWNSATVPEHKCQLSDELEHKIAMIDTSLNRLGMILDSVQADIMQVNKGTKEISLEVEGLRQKSAAHHDSLHLMNRTQEEAKASLETISNRLLTIMQKDKNQEILLAVLNLRDLIDTNYDKQNDKTKQLSGNLQEILCSLNTMHQKKMPLANLPPKVTGSDSSSQMPSIMREAEPKNISKPAQLAPKVEMGRWNTVKAEQTALSNQYGNSCKNLKQRRASLDRKQKVIIDIDNETDDDLSCLIIEKESDKHFMVELEEETAEILRKARRRKRKQNCKQTLVTHRYY